MYRNINGVRFECFESNPGEFEKVKSEAKKMQLKIKMIAGQLFREVRSNA